MKIGTTIKELRKNRDMLQADLARVCNITQTYLSLIEHNKKEPNLSLLKIIAEALNTSVPLLFIMSIDEEDVPASKRESFGLINNALKTLIKSTH